jgi:hypothetical protein
MNLAAVVGATRLVYLKRRLRRTQLKDRDLGSRRRREASGGQYVFEVRAGPPGTDTLLGLPNADVPGRLLPTIERFLS